MITRRGLLAGILAAGAAPVIMRSGILMPVRSIIVPNAWLCGVEGDRLTRLVEIDVPMLREYSRVLPSPQIVINDTVVRFILTPK